MTFKGHATTLEHFTLSLRVPELFAWLWKALNITHSSLFLIVDDLKMPKKTSTTGVEPLNIEESRDTTPCSVPQSHRYWFPPVSDNLRMPRQTPTANGKNGWMLNRIDLRLLVRFRKSCSICPSNKSFRNDCSCPSWGRGSEELSTPRLSRCSRDKPSFEDTPSSLTITSRGLPEWSPGLPK